MLSKEENKLLTQVGPGTPCGKLLRCYWMPVCPVAEISADKPKRRVRLLGENLVLFRDGKGRLGLVQEQCPHRRASLYFGFVENDGLRCSYHGWKFDVEGTCIERPFEKDKNAPVKNCQKAYPVQSLGGVIFGYLGPSPAPLLPRWENLVRKDGVRSITVLPLHHCNWLQTQENSVDPVHTFWLHAHSLKLQGLEPRAQEYFGRPIENYDFEVCHEPAWSGIRKIREYGGDRPEREIGHPAIFPNILMNPQGDALVTHLRSPVDDEHTNIIWAEFRATSDGRDVEQRDEEIPVKYLEHPLQPDGEYNLTSFPSQDLMAWETQGAITDRSREMLGASDRGIVLWRRLLKEQIEAVAQGKEPVGLIRDPAINDIIRFHLSTGQAKAARGEAAE